MEGPNFPEIAYVDIEYGVGKVTSREKRICRSILGFRPLGYVPEGSAPILSKRPYFGPKS